jgi:anti-sigma regulatory factor (Ser/Thr protein kinase)
MVDTVLELAVPARFPEVGALRHAADAFLRESTDQDLRDELMLVVSELCTNAIEAVHNPSGEVTLRVRNRDDSIIIEVEDLGPGFAAAMGRRGARDKDERGRGLQVVAALVDDLTVERKRRRTIVRCSVKK